jgi:hypothetical protein
LKALVGVQIDALLEQMEARMGSWRDSIESQIRADLQKTLGPAIHTLTNEKLASTLSSAVASASKNTAATNGGGDQKIVRLTICFYLFKKLIFPFVSNFFNDKNMI